MPKSWDEIYNRILSRRMADAEIVKRMTETRDRYNGDIVVPLPEVDGNPELPAPVPNLVAEAVDNIGMRAASTTPIITAPTPRPHINKSARNAEKRRQIWYGRWWDSGLHESLLGRAYRQWAGYGTTVFKAAPDFENERAKIELHDPLTAYPEVRSPDEHRPPENIGLVYGRSRRWLESRFGSNRRVRRLFESSQLQSAHWDEMLWDIVEWWDNEIHVIGLLGPRSIYLRSDPHAGVFGGNWGGIELLRNPNRAEVTPFVTPRRLTLERVEGQVVKMLGQQDLLGQLMALEVEAAKKTVFPDLAVLSADDTSPPQLVHGRWVDGREGEANLVQNADAIQLLQSQGSVSALQTTDRIERAARFSGGASPLTQGESPGASLRTGAAIDAAAAFAIDPRNQEAQRVMQRNLGTLNEVLAEVEKAWFSGKTLTAFSGLTGEQEIVTYDPGEVFDETTLNVVRYQFPGADISQVTVGLAQMTGADLISKKTARSKHPYIEDPEQEARNSIEERLIDAELAGLLQRASQGALPEVDMAEIIEAVIEDGKPLYEAVMEAQEAAQERQAEQVPENAPEAQPGLAMPGAGAESQPAPPEGAGSQIPEGEGDLGRLRQLLFDVRESAPEGA